MVSTKYTGKYECGQTVRYSYFTPAISCQSSHNIKGTAKIVGTEKANGTTMYVIDNDTLLFECEIKNTVTPHNRST